MNSVEGVSELASPCGARSVALFAPRRKRLSQNLLLSFIQIEAQGRVPEEKFALGPVATDHIQILVPQGLFVPEMSIASPACQ